VSDAAAIDAYIAAAPETHRAVLTRVRTTIRDACPEAAEVISYGMPAFKLHGKLLLSYAAYKRHYAIYPASGRVQETLGAELTPFLTEKATIRFTDARPIPDDLLRRIVDIRVAENNEAQAGG
jgi:uncharacterized protein YdhG (YjbR/CyaY superfamily)